MGTASLQKIFSNYHTAELQQNTIIVLNDGKEISSNFAAQIASLKDSQENCKSFYVMDTDRINELLDVWFEYLPQVQPFYSLKCNFNTVLLRILALHPSVGFTCESPKDLQNALDFVPPERLLCANPCWTNSSLQQTADQGVQLICFESDRDLDRILANHSDAKLLLHVCVNADSEDPNAQFGCAPEKAPALLKMATEIGLFCVGISFCVGADFACSSIYANAIELSAQLFRVGNALGHQMNVLNIGDVYSTQFTQLCADIKEHLDLYGFQGSTNIMATPGRFFASSVFSLVTNVVAKKSIDASLVTNNDFDSGTEAFLYQISEGYYGSFGCRDMAECDPKCTPLFDGNTFASQEKVFAAVVGPFGSEDPEMDMVQPIVHFAELHIGDWLYWAEMGAYTLDNEGSLDDEQLEETRADCTPAIFYFASRSNWNRISRRLYGCNADESDADNFEQTLHMDDDDARKEDVAVERSPETEDEEDNFWMFGWPLHSY